MELIIKAKNIELEFDGKEILNIKDLELYTYDRIGLVGDNGAGKSTLIKALIGTLSIENCDIERYGRVSYIPQLETLDMTTIEDYSMLSKLGVQNLTIDKMSGGEETRTKIATALSNDVHAIVADEPTNHLDQDGINYLIEKLKYFYGGVLVVSHDRYFLDEVVNKIWELKDGKITQYWGNYSDYLREKEKEANSLKLDYDNYIEEKNRLIQVASEKRRQADKLVQRNSKSPKREKGSGRLAHQKSSGSKQKSLYNAAKSIEQRLNKLEKVEPLKSFRPIKFKQTKSIELHNPYPIIGMNIHKHYDDKIIFTNADFKIPLGKKVALVGGNGVGKTTLVKMIIEREIGIEIASKVRIGYFAQDAYKYDLNQNVMEFMNEDTDYNVSEIRSILASMGFSQDIVRKQLSILSGGELIKLQLSKLLIGKYNVLLMDEPSNFLDVRSLVALEELMINYAGTIFFISHDKSLIEKVADVVLEIIDGKIQEI